jgi:hypothetical protein
MAGLFFLLVKKSNPAKATTSMAGINMVVLIISGPAALFAAFRALAISEPGRAVL